MKKLSFNILEWAKRYINIPSKEEAKKILKGRSKKEILAAYHDVLEVFRTKKSFNLQSIQKSLLLTSALFVLLGNVAQAGLPTIDNLERKYKKFFDSIDQQEKIVDVSSNQRSFLNAMEEIKDVYQKLKSNKEFKHDCVILKDILDKYNKIKENIDSIDDKELAKARAIAVLGIQADSYFGYLANVAQGK